MDFFDFSGIVPALPGLWNGMLMTLQLMVMGVVSSFHPGSTSPVAAGASATAKPVSSDASSTAISTMLIPRFPLLNISFPPILLMSRSALD